MMTTMMMILSLLLLLLFIHNFSHSLSTLFCTPRQSLNNLQQSLFLLLSPHYSETTDRSCSLFTLLLFLLHNDNDDDDVHLIISQPMRKSPSLCLGFTLTMIPQHLFCSRAYNKTQFLPAHSFIDYPSLRKLFH